MFFIIILFTHLSFLIPSQSYRFYTYGACCFYRYFFVEFYSWDFNYQPDKGFKPDVIIDKQGTQRHKFKPGIHHIAIKVVDNEGLDNIEVVKLKVNGTVERA